MPIPSLTLGAEIVRRASVKGRAVSNLSLQKLAYFCHGWHLALFHEPLVDEVFEAWQYGPVLPTLYHSFKPFGSSAIPPNHATLSHIPGLAPSSPSAPLIDRVLDVYGGFSGFQLVELTHRDDGPWKQVFDNHVMNGDIPNAAIEQYFAQQMNR